MSAVSHMTKGEQLRGIFEVIMVEGGVRQASHVRNVAAGVRDRTVIFAEQVAAARMSSVRWREHD